ncbi:hypothetical protein BDZ85DRAFT_297626 [Elsinoe ampelina]|uniref:Uncharacterized protein n=1 Tax=Elsinoe ampelina TaxID=302913 RepID=A0A6A6G5D5_9PEZI|nr:hypothetical protein BDZ85DRAFT_297626 [Elsinoe ampelina]
MAAATTPWPVMRTASTEHLDIRHPTPDLNILPDGAVNHNVARLEQSAEELSQGGSDIGDEIRKLQEEQRRSDSRRSSLNSQAGRANIQQNNHSITSRSRGASTSSYSNSIVDLNREARWGGYSPGAFIGSPAQSINSGSWSQAVLHRSASNAMSTSTRPEPVQEGRPLDSPLASPVASAVRQASHSSLSRSVSIQNSLQPSRRGSRSSKRSSVGSVGSAGSPRTSTKSGDFVETEDVETEKTPVKEPEEVQETEDKENMPHYAHSRHESEQQSIHERPGSSDTYRQANILFQDFDGVHFSPTHEEFVEVDEYGNEIRRIPLELAGQELLHQQELLTPRAHQVTFAHPPPSDHMVYYPAPVPRMLNLPKKLSSKPTPAMIAQRKSQVMMQAPKTNRKSTLQIGEFGFEREQQRASMIQLDEMNEEGGQHSKPASLRSNSPTRAPQSPQRPNMQQRSSMATLSHMQHRASMATLSGHIPANLPPQLRASLFFDAPAAQQNVNIQSDSAVATLDSILQASATAPVSVFTDHPFAGRVGGQIYAREDRPRAKRNTLSNPLITDAKNSARPISEMNPKSPRRKSITGMLTGHQDDDDKPKLARRNSVMSMFTDLGHSDGKKLQKRNSRMSLNSENMLGNESTSRPISPAPSAPLDQAQYQEYDEDQPEDEEAEEDEEEIPDEELDPVYAQPTTLLAELQLRKAQQKTRNRTAATAFPNGMHSTLLQLDAVAQIEAKKRKNHKVALAWEDPSVHAKQNEEVDEDIPLAVLYPTKNGLRPKRPGESDWDRPIGLLEKRRLEDNEPLSSRRNRILGINPKAANRLAPSPSNLSSPHGVSAPASSRGEPSPAYAHSVSNQENQPAEVDEDDLPLAERRRRIQQKAALDSALGDVVAKDNKSTFETDVLSVLIPPAATKPVSPTSAEIPEDETLGQRRARLQREALAANPGGESRPTPVHSSLSLANLLSAVPLDPSKDRMDRDRRNASSPAPGTLLGNHDAKTRDQKEKMRLRNATTSSYMDRGPGLQRAESQGDLTAMGLGQRRRSGTTLLDLNLQPSASMPAGMNQAYVNGAANGAAGALKMAGWQGQQGQQGQGQGQMMNPLAFSNFIPPAPVTGMGFQGGMAAYGQEFSGVNVGMNMQGMGMQGGMMGQGMGMGMQGQGMGMGMQGMGTGLQGMQYPNPMMMNGVGMGVGMGMYNPNMMGYGGMGVAGYGMQDPLLGMDPQRRETIDRWRSSVAQ